MPIKTTLRTEGVLLVSSAVYPSVYRSVTSIESTISDDVSVSLPSCISDETSDTVDAAQGIIVNEKTRNSVKATKRESADKRFKINHSKTKPKTIGTRQEASAPYSM